MVEIPTARVARYIEKPSLSVSAFLLHGTDAGLIREHGAALCRSLAAAFPEEPEMIRVDEDELVGNPDRLTIEAQTVSMFSPGKILRVQVSGRALPALGKFAWSDIPQSVRIVVEAGNLKKDLKLRKLFEKTDALAALPCHSPDDNTHVSQVIRQRVASSGLSISRDAEALLVSVLDVDLGVAKSEIDKLITYCAETGEIGAEDVNAIVGDASQATMDAAADAILANDPAAALNQMEKLRASGTPPDVLLYVLSQHLMRLLRLRSNIDSGTSADVAIKGLRPPPHFRRAGQMKKQVRQWNQKTLKDALQRVWRAQHDARIKPDIAHQIATHVIVALTNQTPSR